MEGMAQPQHQGAYIQEGEEVALTGFLIMEATCTVTKSWVLLAWFWVDSLPSDHPKSR